MQSYAINGRLININLFPSLFRQVFLGSYKHNESPFLTCTFFVYHSSAQERDLCGPARPLMLWFAHLRMPLDMATQNLRFSIYLRCENKELELLDPLQLSGKDDLM